MDSARTSADMVLKAATSWLFFKLSYVVATMTMFARRWKRAKRRKGPMLAYS